MSSRQRTSNSEITLTLISIFEPAVKHNAASKKLERPEANSCVKYYISIWWGKSTNRPIVYDTYEVSQVSPNLSSIEITSDFGLRPYRAICAVFCLLLFSLLALPLSMRKNLEKETKEQWWPLREVPFNLHLVSLCQWLLCWKINQHDFSMRMMLFNLVSWLSSSKHRQATLFVSLNVKFL